MSYANTMQQTDSITHNIVLIGFMGSGKSSVGKEICALNNYFFCDTDDLIESMLDKSITEIFKDLGESAFRAMESRLLKWLKTNAKHCVIATGGGMPIFNNVRDLGVVVHLDDDFGRIVRRLSKEQRASRPLLNDLTKAKELFQTRKNLYKQQADIVIDSKDYALSPKQVAQKIMDYILHLQSNKEQ